MKKLSLLLALSSFALPAIAVAQTEYPVFKPDLSFNKEMPHGYFLGQVAGITEDSHGNIWVIHRPRRVVPQLVQHRGEVHRQRQAARLAGPAGQLDRAIAGDDGLLRPAQQA